MKRVFTVLLALSLLAACGGGDKSSDADGPAAESGKARSGDQVAAGTATTAKPGGGGTEVGGSAGAGGSGGSTGTGGGSTGTGSGGSGTATTAAPTPLPVALLRTCVRRGAAGDKQGFSLKTKPGDSIGYSTTYQGDRNDMTDPQWTTGRGFGTADSRGDYTTSWFLPEDVPTGEAKLYISAQNRLQPVQTFRVVGQFESC